MRPEGQGRRAEASQPALERGFLWVIVALAVALAVFVVAERRIAGVMGFPLDDAWIHFHFARNLAEGHGFAYNPGVPVAGSTAPLWTLVLAAAFALLGAEPLWAKALGIAGTTGTAWLTYRLAGAWYGRPGLGVLAAALTALAGPLVWGALSGMEVSLAALLVTAALLCHTRGSVWAASLLLGLSVLARPESALLVPLVWLALPLTLQRTSIVLGTTALIVAPWVAFNLATAGSPLPAPASAKVEGGLVGLLSGTRESLVTALLIRPWRFEAEWVQWLSAVNILLPVLLLPGLWLLWRHRGRAAAIPALILLLHPLGMALLAPYRGPGFQEGRYSVHLLPLAITVAVAVLAVPWRTPSLASPEGAGERSPSRPPPRPPPGRAGSRLSTGFARLACRPAAGQLPRRSVRALFQGSYPDRPLGRTALWHWPGFRAVGAALLLVASLGAFWPAAVRYAWAVQNIEAMQVHLGRWVARHTPPAARLGLNDVGAITYVSRREVVDLMGVVTPGIIPYRRDGEPGVLRYLESACPDYLVVFPAWFPELSGRAEYFTPLYRVRLEHNTVAGADEMVVYETVWNRWGRRPRPCR